MREPTRAMLFLACLLFTLSIGSAVSEGGQPPGSNTSEGSQVLPRNIDTEKSDEIKSLISSELYVGAADEIIEAFFDRHGVTYSFDKFLNRYQGIVRDVSSDPLVDQAVSIYIYVDAEKRFTGSEVIDTFTAP